MTRISLVSAGVLVAFSLFGGGRLRPTPAPSGPPSAETAPGPAPAPDPPPQEHGKRGGGRFGEVFAYVDGTPVAVVRRSELPPAMTPIAMPKLDGLHVARYFRIYDYVAALGVDPAKVRAVELHGARDRVAAITGPELLRFKDTLVFDFSQETRGKPRARWSVPALAAPTQIDQFTALAVYVTKSAPRYDPKVGALLVDGRRVEGMPYATGDRPGGTRVYVDGKLVGWVKRKLLGNDLIAATAPGKTTYDLPAYLAKAGVDLHAAKTIDLVDGDALAARIAPADPDALPRTFFLPERSQGKAILDLPAGGTARISSIQVFARTTPPARVVDPDATSDGDPTAE